MITAAPPDPDDARGEVLEELSKPEYGRSEGFVAWILRSIEEWLADVLSGVDGSSTVQGVVAVLVLLVLLGAALLLLRRTGRWRGSAALAVDPSLAAEDAVDAAELRARARAALDAGRVDDGTVLALRALVRDLADRTLLDVHDGMTAHEAAVGAARAFPDLRPRLGRAADDFDTAAYSARTVPVRRAEDLLLLAAYVADRSPDPRSLHEAPATGTVA